MNDIQKNALILHEFSGGEFTSGEYSAGEFTTWKFYEGNSPRGISASILKLDWVAIQDKHYLIHFRLKSQEN